MRKKSETTTESENKNNEDEKITINSPNNNNLTSSDAWSEEISKLVNKIKSDVQEIFFKRLTEIKREIKIDKK